MGSSDTYIHTSANISRLYVYLHTLRIYVNMIEMYLVELRRYWFACHLLRLSKRTF